ncbi:MAG: MATE family efflux transporter [Gammaproteobacteria bacterium]|nr:MATE family efflux transporter [Gammaproteobacteria bacterium]
MSEAARSWLSHARSILTLALPVMVARAGVLILIAVDTAMTGHAGADELAAYAIASVPMIPLMLLGIGLMSGTTIFAARAMANGDTREAGRIWRVACSIALQSGTIMALICLPGAWWLELLGQARDLAAAGAGPLFYLSLGLPAVLGFAATSFFLESLGRPLPGVAIILAANILNAFLNWLLIYGQWGFAASGADGAAIATTVVRWLSLIALCVYIYWRLPQQRFGLTGINPQAGKLRRRIWRFGIPMGLAHMLESAAFATMTIFAGWMGTIPLAAFQSAFNLLSLPFMLALGFSTAASVRVASALARKRTADALRAGVTATALCASALAALAISYALFTPFYAGLYSNEEPVLALLLPAIIAAAWVLCPDGMQGTLIGALRGCGDVWPATGLYIMCFWASWCRPDTGWESTRAMVQ